MYVCFVVNSCQFLLYELKAITIINILSKEMKYSAFCLFSLPLTYSPFLLFSALLPSITHLPEESHHLLSPPHPAQWNGLEFDIGYLCLEHAYKSKIYRMPSSTWFILAIIVRCFFGACVLCALKLPSSWERKVIKMSPICVVVVIHCVPEWPKDSSQCEFGIKPCAKWYRNRTTHSIELCRK